MKHVIANIVPNSGGIVAHVFWAKHQGKMKRHTAYYQCCSAKYAKILKTFLNNK